MSNAALAKPGCSVAVTVLGLCTLLLGCVYAAFACWAIFAGADSLLHPSKDAMVQIIALGGIVPALMIVLGVAFLILGILGLLAGFGVLWHKPWGRILTFILAAATVQLGLLWLSGVQDVIQDSTDIVVGAAQILYGILATVILVMNGAEFARPPLQLGSVSDGRRREL